MGSKRAWHLPSMYFLAQWGKKSTLFLVFRNFSLSRRFMTCTPTRSSTSTVASEISRPVSSRTLSLSAKYRTFLPTLLCMPFSYASLASLLKKDWDTRDRSKLNLYGMSVVLTGRSIKLD